MQKTSIVLSLFLLALTGWWIWVVRATIPGSQDPGEPGPQAFPLLLGGALGLLALILLAQGVRGLVKPTGNGDALPGISGRETRIVVSTFLLFMAFAFLLDKIGFLLATPVVLTVAMAGILGMRSVGKVLAVAIGFTVASHLIFNLMLQANLPHGSWIRFG